MKNYKIALWVLLFFAVNILVVSLSEAAFSSKTSIARTTYQPPPSFQTYYSGGQIENYWPILGDKETCEAREDVILQVAPGGCQPAVVRSDLLAEQNVPVFCQIDALTINPLVDIKEIRNIRFSGTYPKGVVGAGFHPARAALSTRDTLLGDPLINNIGYVVVVLKKQEKESEIPGSVHVNLTGIIEYNAGNAFGIGRAEFILRPVSEQLWGEEKIRNSFWNGRYSVRLEQADSASAIISLYYGDRKITTQRVEQGKLSRSTYMPGFFCQAGVQISYDGFSGAQSTARIEVQAERGVESFDVFRGSRFLNDKCEVINIQTSGVKDSGNVTISCQGTGLLGRERIVLQLRSSLAQLLGVLKNKDGSAAKIDSEVYQTFTYYYAEIDGKRYGVREDRSELYVYDKGVWNAVLRQKTSREQQRLAGINEALKAVKELSVEQRDELASKRQIFEDEPLGTGEAELAFAEAMKAYEQVADEFPAERKNEFGAKTYGEEALEKALALAKSTNGKKQGSVQRVLEKLIRLYPESSELSARESALREFYAKDSGLAGVSVNVDNKFRTITLVGINIPDEVSSAVFSLGGGGRGTFSVALEENSSILSGNLERVYLDRVIDEDRVQIRYYCSDAYYLRNRERGGVRYATLTLSVRDDASLVCGDVRLKLESVEMRESVKVRLLPSVKGTSSQTNLSVHIGIEKRVIKLAPDKTKDRIALLNESVQKWESISKNLGNVVKGLKAACFATSATLTVKNFISGIDGTALARQQAMRGEHGWSARCKYAVDNKRILDADGSYRPVEYKTLTACFNGERENIRKEVELREKVITETNQKISEREAKQGSFASGYSVDSIDAQKKFITFLQTNSAYSNDPFVRNLSLPSAEKPSPYSYADLRDWYLNRRLADENVIFALEESKRIEQRVAGSKEILEKISAEKGGLGGSPLILGRAGSEDRDAGAIKVANGKIGAYSISGPQAQHITAFLNTSSDAVRVSVPSGGLAIPSMKNKRIESGDYLLAGTFSGGVFVSDSRVYKYTLDETQKIIILEEANGISADDVYYAGGIRNIKHNAAPLFGNRISPRDQVVRYFETGPDKGLPARVPFDVLNGWYVDVQSHLRIGNQIAAYDASGLPKAWKICNVGANGIIDESDDCGLVNVGINYDAPLLGLPREQSRQLVEKSQRAILEAARQKGNKIITINGQQFYQGAPMTQFDSVQCQDFMSPEDCKLLFNVCDPVICPATRCDFGGKYPVADVIQTGIVGSALLCLPNYQEGIYVPVCLSGISAGIDAYVSVLKSHRDCLQENLQSGKMIGICDELYSIYACEFFWRQIAPVANVLLPKLVELAYGRGQGARGGGEYLTVMGAWDNTRKSIDYFTQTYAVNSLKAFRARSLEEAGGEFCKGFISTKAPTNFKSLVEPDSPPQFYAYFDTTLFTSATVPATAQYKVYYHIFAGKDAGIYYNVYLKSPPDSSYYYNSPRILVANGFLARGQSADQTRDFTAPEGYKELCVRINDEEKCGFKQVTTDFAVNYLRDKSVQSELERSDIKTERECVSGSPNLGSALTPSIQAGLEESAFPQIAERGIVRICSTRNPGESTEPTRYVQVGICGSNNLKCWLDKKSVSNAITDSNKGIKNETLSALEERQRIKDLERRGIVSLGNEQANGIISEIKQDVESFVKAYGEGYGGKIDVENVNSRAQALLGKMEQKFGARLDNLVLNHHKAEVLLLKGRVKEVVAKNYLSYERAKIGSQVSNTGTSTDIVNKDELNKSYAIKFDEKYAPSSYTRTYIYFNGLKGNIFLQRDGIYYKTTAYRIGDVRPYKNAIDKYILSLESEYNVVFGSKRTSELIGLETYKSLDGAILDLVKVEDGFIYLQSSLLETGLDKEGCKVEIYQNGKSVSEGSFDKDIEAVVSGCNAIPQVSADILLKLPNEKRLLDNIILSSITASSYSRNFKEDEVADGAEYIIEIKDDFDTLTASDSFKLISDNAGEIFSLVVDKNKEVNWKLNLKVE